jgi:hypothetical protein
MTGFRWLKEADSPEGYDRKKGKGNNKDGSRSFALLTGIVMVIARKIGAA